MIVKFWFLLLLWFIPSGCFADARNELNFVGFSKDGKFLAFESFGDGTSGLYVAESTFYFVSVTTNKYAQPPIAVIDSHDKECEKMKCKSLAEVRKEAADKSRPVLNRLGIISGNLGFHAYSRLEGDLTTLAKLKLKMGKGSLDSYIVSLASKPVHPSGGEAFQSPLLLKLEIQDYFEIKENMPHILQEDTKPPQSRAGVIAYEFKDVYFFAEPKNQTKTLIAVFLQKFTPGFEGPDLDFMVVTGVVP